MTNADDMGKIFDTYDEKNRGFLVIDDLRRACPNFDPEEIEFVFKTLDKNKNGRIERTEFIDSFESVLLQGQQNGFSGIHDRFLYVPSDALRKESRQQFGDYLAKEENIYVSEPESRSGNERLDLPCEDEVLRLYEQLQCTGVPQLLSQFEKVVGKLYVEINEHKSEKNRIKRAYDSEKEMYNRRMADVEIEIDHQLTLTEQKARAEERERLTREKEEMRERLEGEMQELKGNINRLAKMEALLKKESEKTDSDNELKVKIQLQEVSKENRELKSHLAENHIELALIKTELTKMRTEYEAKSMELLNDKESVFETIRSRETMQKQLQLLYDANLQLQDYNHSLREMLEKRSAMCKEYNIRGSPSPSQSRENSYNSFHDLNSARFRQSPSPMLSFPPTPFYLTDEDIDSGLGGLAMPGEMSEGDSSDDPDVPFTPREEKVISNGLMDATGPPERTFRVVLCGDASVGKSSIIMRIVKRKFTGNLPSTLGVDYHLKNLRLDEKNVAIQLWDTAGQERFRSLCKSYFRRADGAILVYDCTAEQSFLRIRGWLDTLKEAVTRPIPVIVCGNKTDLRIAAAANGIRTVGEEDGASLAKNLNVMFVETSALDGTNVDTAVLHLTRELMAQEDIDREGSKIIVTPGAAKAKSSCFSRPSCSK